MTTQKKYPNEAPDIPIKILKLVGGEEIICGIKMPRTKTGRLQKTPKFITVIEPTIIHNKNNYSSGERRIFLEKWCVHTDDIEIPIPVTQIVVPVDPSPEMEAMYLDYLDHLLSREKMEAKESAWMQEISAREFENEEAANDFFTFATMQPISDTKH